MILFSLYDQCKYNYCEKMVFYCCLPGGDLCTRAPAESVPRQRSEPVTYHNQTPHNRATNIAIIFTTRTSGYSYLQRPVTVGDTSLYQSTPQASNDSVQTEHIYTSTTSFYILSTSTSYQAIGLGEREIFCGNQSLLASFSSSFFC